MSGNRVSEILHVEGALESRSEESSKRCDEGSEYRHDDRVELEGCPWDLVNRAYLLRQHERAPDEYVVRGTHKVREGGSTQVCSRTDHVVEAHKQGGPGVAEHDCCEECSDETLYSLLRR